MGLIFDAAQYPVDCSHFVFLIDKQVFIGESDVFFSVKNRVGRDGCDYIGAVDQFFVSAPAGSVKAGKGGFGDTVGEPCPDDIAGKIRVKPYQSRDAGAFYPLPFGKDYFNRIFGKGIVGIDADIKLCVDIFICLVLCAVCIPPFSLRI